MSHSERERLIEEMRQQGHLHKLLGRHYLGNTALDWADRIEALDLRLTPERIAKLYAEQTAANGEQVAANGGEQDEDTPAGQVGDSGSSPEPAAPYELERRKTLRQIAKEMVERNIAKELTRELDTAVDRTLGDEPDEWSE